MDSMSPWQKKLINVVIFNFDEVISFWFVNYTSVKWFASDVNNRGSFTKGISYTNFNFMPYIEVAILVGSVSPVNILY